MSKQVHVDPTKTLADYGFVDRHKTVKDYKLPKKEEPQVTQAGKKFTVEFDVERTVDKGDGYEEKLLSYHHPSVPKTDFIRYKGIIKDGKLAAILGSQYKLLKNEDVVRATQTVKEAHKDAITESEVVYEGWKLYVYLLKDKHGVLVRNSVDGTCALQVIAFTKIDGSYAFLVGNRVQTAYKRHTTGLNVGELDKAIEETLKASVKYGEWLAKMDTVTAVSEHETLSTLLDELPKSYTKGAVEAMLKGVAIHGSRVPTVRDVYEALSRKIWANDNKMVTKLAMFRNLNDIIYVAVGID